MDILACLEQHGTERMGELLEDTHRRDSPSNSRTGSSARSIIAPAGRERESTNTPKVATAIDNSVAQAAPTMPNAGIRTRLSAMLVTAPSAVRSNDAVVRFSVSSQAPLATPENANSVLQAWTARTGAGAAES